LQFYAGCILSDLSIREVDLDMALEILELVEEGTANDHEWDKMANLLDAICQAQIEYGMQKEQQSTIQLQDPIHTKALENIIEDSNNDLKEIITNSQETHTFFETLHDIKATLDLIIKTASLKPE
jgi:hypothetical protein